MPRGLRDRTATAELMDDFSMGGQELNEALRHLRRLNRIFAASAPTLFGVKRLWKRAGKPHRLSVLDIGAGSGDVNRQLLKWADQRGITIAVQLVDVTEEACAEARRYYRNEPRIQVVQGDLFALPVGSADIVTATQFLHHFDEGELPHAARCMLQASKMGIVVNDIHRHTLAWIAVWLTTRLISSNRYIRNDGPLSVAKGFRAEDWEKLGQALGTKEMYYSWRPLFRYAVVIDKQQSERKGGAERDDKNL
ncbi:methyltransferase domain-containing protein [Paenibacillus sinopodophylli]|uniref:methyltransferase domain-containing protein n=1 Tax=Paenibacillus sinopodophylli TaxID=1837342 RepID=UPI001486D2B8|nr:methyltransferase domain-containing protein [Paenibacillus sinopodophylli]